VQEIIVSAHLRCHIGSGAQSPIRCTSAGCFVVKQPADKTILLASMQCRSLECVELYVSVSIHVRLEVFTAVTMKNVVLWDVTPCGSCKKRRFGGT
jgi:hypothetical protein